MQEPPVLRPLSVGDIIDRVLRLIRANLVLFVGIALIPDLVIEVLQRVARLDRIFDLDDLQAVLSAVGGGATIPRPPAVDPGVVTAVVLVSIAISIVQTGALTAAIGRRYLGGPITIREAYARGLRAAPRLILSGLAIVVLFSAAFVVLGIALAVISGSLEAVAAIIGLIVIVIALPWAFLSLALVVPALVLEGIGPIAAIRRSVQLMDRARLRALGLYVLLGLIAIILGVVFSLVSLASFVTEPTIRTVLQVIANVASASLSGPLIAGGTVLLYYDLHPRRSAPTPE